MPKNPSMLNYGLLPQKNYIVKDSQIHSGMNSARAALDKDDVRKSLNRKRAGAKMRSLDPYRSDNVSTENPKIKAKCMLLKDTMTHESLKNTDLNARDNEPIHPCKNSTEYV
jgi:hypothetical protein